MNICNPSKAQRTFGGRFLYGRLLALSASAALLCGAGAAQAGPCSMLITQFERQIAIDWPPPVVSGTLGVLPQSLDAQLHHQPTIDSVVQAEHFTFKDGNASLDKAWKADNAGDAAGCNQALVEARRLYYFKD
jgi:hypothetical protein